MRDHSVQGLATGPEHVYVRKLSMQGIIVGHASDRSSLEAVVEEFSSWHPQMRLGVGAQAGPGTLGPEWGGVRYLWIESGDGRAFVPEGYRTQEGDGDSLPSSYVLDPLDEAAGQALRDLAEFADRVNPAIQQPIRAILDRRSVRGFRGNIAGELWQIRQSGLTPEAWAETREAVDGLEYLFAYYRELGWSTKTSDGWESLRPGDQLTLTEEQPLQVDGQFRYWWIEDLAYEGVYVSALRRLTYIKDTAGGCNFAFDAFRRMPMTWCVGSERPDNADGLNRVNSHVVNIPEETSPTHFHPEEAIGGGLPQSEMYLVLDPADWSLSTYGREAKLYTYPDLGDLRNVETTVLPPGTIVHIKPGTGHRGSNVFVNVVTIPGFKPHNEFYIDRLIKEQAGDAAPYNPSVVENPNQETSN